MKSIILFLLLQFSVLAFAQSLDPTFNVGTGVDPFGDGYTVNITEIQPAGKVIIGGHFALKR